MTTGIATKRSDSIIILVIVVLTLFAYWPVGNYGFVNFDDDEYVYNNTYVWRGISLDSVFWAFSITDKHGSHWHPLTWLSHMLDCQLFGLDAGMHHLMNLFFHILNTLLLFRVFYLMSGNVWPSGFIAVFFALHPINVDSVVWIAERKNVLSTFFWLLTILAYFRYSKKPGFYRYLNVLLFFLFGLMAKPMLLTLPFVLFLLDYWPLGRIEEIKKANFKIKNIDPVIRTKVFKLILEKIPFIALCMFLLIMSGMALQGSATSFDTVSIQLRLENAIVSYIEYIGKIIWPINFAVYYPYPKTISLSVFIFSSFLLISVTILVFREWKNRPYLVVGWLWYLGTLIPVIGIIQVGLWPAMADRWAYVPSIGLFIIVACLIPDKKNGTRNAKKIFMTSGAIIIVLIFLITVRIQLRYWANSVSLWTHALSVTPDNYVARNNLGNALADQGMLSEAIKHYLSALEMEPMQPDTYNNIGIVYAKQGRVKKAVKYYKKALNISPNYVKAINNLGVAYASKGMNREAIVCFRRALSIEPAYHDALINLEKLKNHSNKNDDISDKQGY